MSAKITRPMIGKLTELLVPGNRAAGGVLPESGASPRGPLDFGLQSPGGVRSGGYDHLAGGVGLGILAALERSAVDCRRAVCLSKLNRSGPIPMTSSYPPIMEDMEEEAMESFTFVTCRRPDRTSVTKVYYDGGSDSLREIKKSSVDDFAAMYPTSDFLSCCNLCRKMLDGKDIYMYRGEKGFCSPECRARHMMMDERKEQCRSEAKLSSSPTTTTERFISTRILAI